MKTKEYLPKKILLTLNSPNFGGRSSRNVQDFGSNPKVLSYSKTYLAMFLRTSSLKQLNSFGAAENIPCCVPKNTSLKFQFVVCKRRDCHRIGK